MTTHITEIPRPTASRRVAAEVRAELARQGVSGRAMATRMGRDATWASRHIGVRATSELSVDEVLEMAEALGVPAERFLLPLLPRLDSNQQPSGYQSAEVIPLVTPLDDDHDGDEAA